MLDIFSCVYACIFLCFFLFNLTPPHYSLTDRDKIGHSDVPNFVEIRQSDTEKNEKNSNFF